MTPFHRIGTRVVDLNLRARRIWQQVKIKGGVRCGRCHFQRFRWQAYCPRCMDQALREMDTSMRDETGGSR